MWSSSCRTTHPISSSKHGEWPMIMGLVVHQHLVYQRFPTDLIYCIPQSHNSHICLCVFLPIRVLSSVSSTSLGSLTSISSNWSLSSSSDDVISLPDTPLTSSPSAPEEDGRYSPLLHRPCGAGLEELHRDPTSHQPAQFNICQKVLQELWGEPTPNWESLNELIPGAPNLQQASEVTSETDFDSISSRRSREEALSKWERHQPLSDQEEVQRSSSWEMFAVVPRPSSCE